MSTARRSSPTSSKKCSLSDFFAKRLAQVDDFY